MNLPPVLTIAGVLLIGKLFGLAGLVIAVPILALDHGAHPARPAGRGLWRSAGQAKPAGTRPAAAEPTVTARSQPPEPWLRRVF